MKVFNFGILMMAVLISVKASAQYDVNGNWMGTGQQTRYYDSSNPPSAAERASWESRGVTLVPYDRLETYHVRLVPGGQEYFDRYDNPLRDLYRGGDSGMPTVARDTLGSEQIIEIAVESLFSGAFGETIRTIDSLITNWDALQTMRIADGLEVFERGSISDQAGYYRRFCGGGGSAICSAIQENLNNYLQANPNVQTPTIVSPGPLSNPLSGVGSNTSSSNPVEGTTTVASGGENNQTGTTGAVGNATAGGDSEGASSIPAAANLSLQTNPGSCFIYNNCDDTMGNINMADDSQNYPIASRILTPTERAGMSEAGMQRLEAFFQQSGIDPNSEAWTPEELNAHIAEVMERVERDQALQREFDWARGFVSFMSSLTGPTRAGGVSGRDIALAGHVGAPTLIFTSVAAAREAGANAAGLAHEVNSAALMMQMMSDLVNRAENAFREGDTE